MTQQPGLGGPYPLDGLIHGDCLRRKGRRKSCSPDVGREGKAFPFTSCTTSKLPFPDQTWLSASSESWEQVPTSLTMVKGGSVERLCRVRLPRPTPWCRQRGSRRLLEKRLDLIVHEGQGLGSLFILFNTFLLFWFFSSFECVKMENELISRKKTS